MANQRDINRWKKGRDHWNKWAEGRLKAKEKLETEGKWEVDGSGNGKNPETKRWTDAATTDFTGHVFEEDANFETYIFPHTTKFNDAIFMEKVWFDNSKFFGSAQFVNAKFSNIAGFLESTFHGLAWFRKATFHELAQFDLAIFYELAWFRDVNFVGTAGFAGSEFRDNSWFRRAIFAHTAWFYKASFDGHADFDECEFNGNAVFDATEFLQEATFRSVKSDGPFGLDNAQFHGVPNFIQSSFRAPPRLDDVIFVDATPFQWIATEKQGVSGIERAARYRALKKLAIESHDHEREQKFFVSEVRERRGGDDPTFGSRWFFGLAYELLSDFGRSITRPIGWISITALAFAAFYGTNVSDTFRKTCKWQSDWLLPEIYLSFLHSLPIVGFGRGEKRNQALDCLFGDKTNVSPALDILFIGQNIWSAILIFLFLLAVRNHFRIK